MTEEMPRFSFPDVPPCTYGKPPFNSAVIQVKFSPILRIAQLPADFQDLVQGDWPHFSPRQKGSPGQKPSWAFTSALSDEAVVLEVDTFTLQTGKCERWTTLRDKFLSAHTAFAQLYRPQHYLRVGVRYQNVFSRQEYGFTGVSWADLFNPALTGILANNDLAHAAFSHVSQTSIRLARPPGGGANLLVQLGEVQADDREEVMLLLDGDFYVDAQSIPAQSIKPILDELHGNAHGYLRWAVGPELLKRMEPQPIAD